MKEIRRKHFRFPAYDDVTGVKLPKKEKRVLFDGHDELLTEIIKQPMFEPMQEFHFAEDSEKEQRKRRKVGHSKKTTVVKEDLEKYKEHLPDYTGHKEVGKTLPKTQNRSFSTTRSSNEGRTRRTTETHRTRRERSYFVPKYVPASIISEPKEQTIPDSELIQSMKKTEDSYLLFDNEQVPYQEKKVDEPSVKPFHKAEKSTPEQSKKERSHGILERSLQGLIEDQGNSLGENSYFKK